MCRLCSSNQAPRDEAKREVSTPQESVTRIPSPPPPRHGTAHHSRHNAVDDLRLPALPLSLHPSCSGVKCSQQLLVLLAAACLFFYVGAETGFGGYIASFVSSHRTRMSGVLPPPL